VKNKGEDMPAKKAKKRTTALEGSHNGRSGRCVFTQSSDTRARVPGPQHSSFLTQSSVLSPQSSSSAFTLIEVIVVMALMALVTGLGAVYFAGNVGSSRVARSARDVAGTIRYGRALAAESGEARFVVFNLDSRSYAIEGRQPKVLPADIAMRVVDQLRGELSRGTHSMRLLPSGGVEGGTIVLQKGRSIVNIYPDPVVGVTVVKQ
jgi:prepilin-type N-terminal cleavage/methylation domain-containing protein